MQGSRMQQDGAGRGPGPMGRGARRSRRTAVAAAVALSAFVLAACGGGTAPTAQPVAEEPSAEEPGGTGTAEVLRLGHFPNVTHGPALVGISEGLFAEALGADTALEVSTFNAGGEAIEALLSGAIDATFIGPNPAINGFARSEGAALRIVAGSTSGGAYLVTRPDLTDPAQLAGTTLSSPALGNTQDVALRAWLASVGYETTPEGGGDVAILPQENAQILETFIAGEIDGAWVPEPWATRMLTQGGGRVLVDERDLWEETGGEYVTTHLIVSTAFLEAHPETVRALIAGHLAAIDRINADPDAAATVIGAGIAAITGTSPDPTVIRTALGNLTFTADPIARSLQRSAEDAIGIGLLDPVDLAGIYDLTLLNAVLVERGEAEVSAG